jgi:hypothetical protein
MTIADLKVTAGNIARAIRESGASTNRNLPPQLRALIVEVRGELFQRGVFDPVLARFDSATVPQVSLQELADELVALASNL